MTMPPMNVWGYLVRHGRGGPHYWNAKPVKIKPLGGGSYQLCVKDSHVIAGSFTLIDDDIGFRISNATSTSSRLTWQAVE